MCCLCGSMCVNFKRLKRTRKKSRKFSNSGLFDYRSYDAIPAGKKAWITIRAIQQGKDPKMAHAGVKAEFTKRGK